MKHYAGLDISVKETSVYIVDETQGLPRGESHEPSGRPSIVAPSTAFMAFSDSKIAGCSSIRSETICDELEPADADVGAAIVKIVDMPFG
jgi:hypothetical protein